MLFNRKTLALAIASVISSSAYATADLNAGTYTAIYANEFPVPVTGATLVSTILDAQAQAGFSITAGTSKYVRIDFVGAQVTNGPLSGGDGVTTGDLRTPNAANVTLSAGGGNGQSFAIFEVTAGGTAIAAGDTFTFAPDLLGASGADIKAFSQSAQTLRYRLFETATAAVNQTGALADTQGTWYSFAPSLIASCEAQVDPDDKINVIKPTEFKSGLGNAAHPIYPFDLDVDTTKYKFDASTVAMPDLMGNGTTIVMTGSMVGFTGTGYIDGDFGFLANIVPNGTNTAGTWTIDGVNNTIPFTGEEPHFQPNTTDAMVPSNYSIVINPTGGVLTQPINLGVCGKLVYSGSTDRVDLSLTPLSEGGSGKQFVRVTNPSDTDGKVTFTMVNDLGKEVSFPISAVTAGGAALPAVLNKGASTPLISLDTLYAVAQSVDATFAVDTHADGSKGKLRIIVRGDFGDETLDANQNEIAYPLKQGIYIQSVTNSVYLQNH